MEYQDKVIVCEDCRKEFTHSAADQARYAERGFTADPKRCRPCREKRKAESAERKARGPRPGGGGGRRPGGGGGGGARRPEYRGGGSRERVPQGQGGGYGGTFGGGGAGGVQSNATGLRASFEAICAACGARTTLPFAPAPGRPVYCRECYRALKRDE